MAFTVYIWGCTLEIALIHWSTEFEIFSDIYLNILQIRKNISLNMNQACFWQPEKGFTFSGKPHYCQSQTAFCMELCFCFWFRLIGFFFKWLQWDSSPHFIKISNWIANLIKAVFFLLNIRSAIWLTLIRWMGNVLRIYKQNFPWTIQYETIHSINHWVNDASFLYV